jgi:N-glycosylase/DNA lyase
MLVDIQDDFDLKKIAHSGQCFRVRCFEDDSYRFMTGEHILYIRREMEGQFYVSCDAEEWEKVWWPYFDLDRCYSDMFEQNRDRHPFVREAMMFGRGLRVLRQDPWEMLVSFIISQRKSIPAISKSVEMLAEKFGHRVETSCESVFTFPTPKDLEKVSLNGLKECGLGYRVRYVLDAIHKAAEGVLDMEALSAYNDAHLLEALQQVDGVGKKVANCVALFGYGRSACAPVDVWISRAIKDECGGQSPFPLFGDNAGIIQQYIFYYEKYCQFKGR